MINENLKIINENILNACMKSGRDSEDVQLIAVTKTVEVDSMKICKNSGVKIFGENRVQELTRKFDDFDNSVDWHLIGHLQTNKVKYIIGKTKLIHSLDSEKLAVEIDKQGKKNQLVIDVLIEVNIALEDSKFGVKPCDVISFADSLKDYKNICIRGLMTVAPFYENPENTRIHFKKMKNLFDELKKHNGSNLKADYLSMGMTNDYIIAIEEGSNMIRVGTGIFGERL